MYASEQESIWNKVAEISTWVLLFVALVPGTALGYFAENSLPNSPLYPVKRGIETVVLSLVSLNSSTKSFYQLSLANTRVSEAQQIFASNAHVTSQDISQLDIITSQLAAANESINSVSDPTQKAQLHAQLQTTIAKYQTQLTQLNQQLVTNSSSSTSQTSTTTPTSNTQDNTTSAEPTPEPTSFDSTNNTSPVPPNFSSLTQNQKTALQQQIQQTSDELTQLEDSMQADQQRQHMNRRNNDGQDFQNNN